MDEEEARSAYEGIAGMLQEIGLKWVIDQVEESISRGKTVAIEADASEFIEDVPAGQRRGRRQMQKFVTTQPFSDTERLLLLLDAIGRIMALPQFEADVCKMLETDSVIFASEREGDDDCSMRSDSGQLAETEQVRLRELRRQVEEPIA